MKRIRNWVNGGIRSKIIALILFAQLRLFVANPVINLY